jgi:hypothetical protein
MRSDEETIDEVDESVTGDACGDEGHRPPNRHFGFERGVAEPSLRTELIGCASREMLF